jgi:hypothetical protein
VRVQYEFFIPAETAAEAISRIHTLLGSADTGRGEKRAVVALRDALGLDVDVVATNAVMGSRIAQALDVDWDPHVHTVRNKLTLDGLNHLLFGATLAYQRGELARVDHTPATLQGPQWHGFNPARNKLEAVTRIAALTDAPPEWLGPGSKEHKSALANLADRLFGDIDTSVSKHRLGAALAARLGVEWTDRCFSTGYTISLEGLNVILAGAELHVGRLGLTAASALDTPEREGDALAWTLRNTVAGHWDGRECIEWMAARGVRGANDNEWQGFYFEAVARDALAQAFAPPFAPPVARFANTTFDYALNRVWDLKVHTHGSDWVILNDADAIRACVREQGLGFLIVTGDAHMDVDGQFAAWHREFKGKPSAASNSGVSRQRKRAFTPTRVDALWIEDEAHLERLIDVGCMRQAAQGRQARTSTGEPGAARADKFHLNLKAANDVGLPIATYPLPAVRPV